MQEKQNKSSDLIYTREKCFKLFNRANSSEEKEKHIINYIEGVKVKAAKKISKAKNPETKTIRIDLSHLDLRGINFTEIPLVVEPLKQTYNCTWHFVFSFDDSDLRNVNLKNKQLCDIHFNSANLSGVDFTNTDLTNTNFTSANLTRAKFAGDTIFASTRFNSSNIAGSNWRKIKYFSDFEIDSRDHLANLLSSAISTEEKEQFVCIYIQCLQQKEAKKLSQRSSHRSSIFTFIIDLNNLDLRGINFSKIPLTLAPILGKPRTYHSYDEDGVITRSSTYTDKSEVHFQLSHSDLRGAILKRQHLCRINFSYANLCNVDLSKSDLTDSNFTGAILCNVDFTGSNIERALFRKANLSGSLLHKANNFSAGLLKDAYLWGALVPEIQLGKDALLQEQAVASQISTFLYSSDPLKEIFIKLSVPSSAKKKEQPVWLWTLTPPELRMLFSIRTNKINKNIKKFYQEYGSYTQEQLKSFVDKYACAIKYVNREMILASLEQKIILKAMNEITYNADVDNHIYSILSRYTFFHRHYPMLNKEEIKRSNKIFEYIQGNDKPEVQFRKKYK